MDIHTYLKYNNVALIDPEDTFQASCIKQYETKGYLSPNQLRSLRSWAHSVAAIERLTACVPNKPLEKVAPLPTPVSDTVKAVKWTSREINNVIELVTKGTTNLEDISHIMNRDTDDIQNMLYRNGDCTITKGNVTQFEPLPF